VLLNSKIALIAQQIQAMKALSFYVSEFACQAKTGGKAQMGRKESQSMSKSGKASSIQHLTPFPFETIGRA
jgi:hypothetical protein